MKSTANWWGKKSKQNSGVTANWANWANWELPGCSCSWPGQLACSKPGCEQISCIFQKSCGICNVVIVGVAVAGALRFYFGQRVKIREVTLVQIILQDKPAHLTCYQCKRCRRAQSANPADAEDTEYTEDTQHTEHTHTYTHAHTEDSNMRRIVIKRRQLQLSSNNHTNPSPAFLFPLPPWPTDMQLTPKESQPGRSCQHTGHRGTGGVSTTTRSHATDA